jgi:mannonate dehydratase
MNRRDAIKGFGLGALGTMATMVRPDQALSQTYSDATRGLAPLKITKVRAIKTSPQSPRLVVVKVETSEPGLYGLGCATYNQRPLTVVTAIDEYLDPSLVGETLITSRTCGRTPIRVRIGGTARC